MNCVHILRKNIVLGWVETNVTFRDQHVTRFNPDAPFVSGRYRHIDRQPFHMTCHVDLTPLIATWPRSKCALLRLYCRDPSMRKWSIWRLEGKCKAGSWTTAATLLAICVCHSVASVRVYGCSEWHLTDRTESTCYNSTVGLLHVVNMYTLGFSH